MDKRATQLELETRATYKTRSSLFYRLTFFGSALALVFSSALAQAGLSQSEMLALFKSEKDQRAFYLLGEHLGLVNSCRSLFFSFHDPLENEIQRTYDGTSASIEELLAKYSNGHKHLKMNCLVQPSQLEMHETHETELVFFEKYLEKAVPVAISQSELLQDVSLSIERRLAAAASGDWSEFENQTSNIRKIEVQLGSLVVQALELGLEMSSGTGLPLGNGLVLLGTTRIENVFRELVLLDRTSEPIHFVKHTGLRNELAKGSGQIREGLAIARDAFSFLTLNQNSSATKSLTKPLLDIELAGKKIIATSFMTALSIDALYRAEGSISFDSELVLLRDSFTAESNKLDASNAAFNASYEQYLIAKGLL